MIKTGPSKLEFSSCCLMTRTVRINHKLVDLEGLEFDRLKSMNTLPSPFLDDFSLVTLETTAPVYQRICTVQHHGRCLGLSELLVPADYPSPSKFLIPENKPAEYIYFHFKSRYGPVRVFPSSQLLHSQVLFHHSKHAAPLLNFRLSCPRYLNLCPPGQETCPQTCSG